MNQADYKAIAEIIEHDGFVKRCSRDYGMKAENTYESGAFSARKAIALRLADYFKEHQCYGQYFFSKKQFLKDCGVQE